MKVKRTLYTAGFFPLSGEKADLGLGILPAVQLALDDITDNNIIPGYKLDLVGNDTNGMYFYFLLINWIYFLLIYCLIRNVKPVSYNYY